MTTEFFCFYLKNRLIQTSQTGGQWYSDTSPFRIPWCCALVRQWQNTKLWWYCQGILKGGVSLYCCPPVWLVRNQPYDDWNFLFLFVKQTNPNQSNMRSMVQWYFPLSHSLMLCKGNTVAEHYARSWLQNLPLAPGVMMPKTSDHLCHEFCYLICRDSHLKSFFKFARAGKRTRDHLDYFLSLTAELHNLSNKDINFFHFTDEQKRFCSCK